VLKIIVELWPGGAERGHRVLAMVDIGRVKNGALADYRVDLHDSVLGEIGAAIVREYPRHAASVLDLVVCVKRIASYSAWRGRV
jgi:hypothetical protein